MTTDADTPQPTPPGHRRIALALLQFDFAKQDMFELNSWPGRLVEKFIKFEQPSMLLSTREPPKPKPIGCALIEIDIDAEGNPPPPMPRRFVTLTFGAILSWPGEVTFFTSFINPDNGALVALYEVLSTDMDELARVRGAGGAEEASAP